MPAQQTLRVAEEAEIGAGKTELDSESVELTPHVAPQHYASAEPVGDWSVYDDHYSFPRFISEVLSELDKEFDTSDARVVDAMPDTADIRFGLLLAYPDESLMFVGSDPTANDAIPWFAFVIEPMEPVPAPESAQDALDMLKPPTVQDVVHEEDWLPDRHGEWWLLPTKDYPVSGPYKPGVGSKPYGPSPLGNHVPREYAFTVSEETFMERFRDRVPEAPSTLASPDEVIEWTERQLGKAPTPEFAPDWADIRQIAEKVLVRGTIRHRDNDHFVEDCGDVWHEAVTHNIEVYTGDGMAERVHLDYHGL